MTLQHLSHRQHLGHLQQPNHLRPLQQLPHLQHLTQPFGQQTYRNLYQQGLDDAYKIQSLSDVLFNVGGQKRVVEDAFSYRASEELNKHYLARVAISGVHYIKNQYLVPLFQGDIGSVVYNSLAALGRDVDWASNPMKGIIVESDSQNISAAMALLGAIVGGTTAVATGGIAPATAAIVSAGISGITAAFMNDSSKAVEGFLKGTGLSGEGRYYYVFDYDTGNGIVNYGLNMLSEIIYDPLNWATGIYKSLSNPILKKSFSSGVAQSISESALGAFQVFHKIDQLSMGAAYYLNPLGATMKGSVAAVKFLKGAKNRTALRRIIEFADKKETSFKDMVEVERATKYAHEGLNSVRKKHVELDVLKGKNGNMVEFTRRLYRRFADMGAAPSELSNMTKATLKGIMSGDYSVLEQFSSTHALMTLLQEFQESFKAPVGVFSTWSATFNAWSKVDDLIDYLVESAGIQDSAQEAYHKVLFSWVKEFDGFLAKRVPTLGEDSSRINLFKKYLIERFPELTEFLDPTKQGYDRFLKEFQNTQVFDTLEKWTKHQGLTLEEVFRYVDRSEDILKELNEGAQHIYTPLGAISRRASQENRGAALEGVIASITDGRAQMLDDPVEVHAMLKDGKFAQLPNPRVGRVLDLVAEGDYIERYIRSEQELYTKTLLENYNHDYYNMKKIFAQGDASTISESIKNILLDSKKGFKVEKYAVDDAVEYIKTYHRFYELFEMFQRNPEVELSDGLKLEISSLLKIMRDIPDARRVYLGKNLNTKGYPDLGRLFIEEMQFFNFAKNSGIYEQAIVTEMLKEKMYFGAMNPGFQHLSVIQGIMDNPIGQSILTLADPETDVGKALEIMANMHSGNPDFGRLIEQSREFRNVVQDIGSLTDMVHDIDLIVRKSTITEMVKPSIFDPIDALPIPEGLWDKKAPPKALVTPRKLRLSNFWEGERINLEPSTTGPVRVFVFGSNLEGIHGAGAAKEAAAKYHAIRGGGEGLNFDSLDNLGSYALPTKETPRKSLSLEDIEFYIESFQKTTQEHPDKVFYVSAIGTGLAGHSAEDISELFNKFSWGDNVKFPRSFGGDVAEETIKSKLKENIGLTKIISGGQQGSDIAGLLVAEELGIATGGYMPLGFRTQLGYRPEYATRFGLEQTADSGYTIRTMKNVDNSDATIAFLLKDSPGTRRTIHYAHTKEWADNIGNLTGSSMHKPYVVISTHDKQEAVAQVVEFLNFNKPSVLNIAGNADPLAIEGGPEGFVKDVLKEALEIISGSERVDISFDDVVEEIKILKDEGIWDATLQAREESLGAVTRYVKKHKGIQNLPSNQWFSFEKPIGSTGGILHKSPFSYAGYAAMQELAPEFQPTQGQFNDIMGLVYAKHQNDKSVPMYQHLIDVLEKDYGIVLPENPSIEAVKSLETDYNRLINPVSEVEDSLQWWGKARAALEKINPETRKMFHKDSIPTFVYNTPFARLGSTNYIKADEGIYNYYGSFAQAFYGQMAKNLGETDVQSAIVNGRPFEARSIFTKSLGDPSRKMSRKKVDNLLDYLIKERIKVDPQFAALLKKVKGRPLIDGNFFGDNFLGVSSVNGQNLYGEALMRAAGSSVEWRSDLFLQHGKQPLRTVTKKLSALPLKGNTIRAQMEWNRDILDSFFKYHTENPEILDQILHSPYKHFEEAFIASGGNDPVIRKQIQKLRERMALFFEGSRLTPEGTMKDYAVFDTRKVFEYSYDKTGDPSMADTFISMIQNDSRIKDVYVYANNGPITSKSEARKVLNYFMAMDSINKTASVVDYPNLHIIADGGNHVYSMVNPILPHIGEPEDLLKPAQKIGQFLSSSKNELMKGANIAGDNDQIVEFLNYIKELSAVGVFDERKGRTSTSSILNNLFLRNETALHSQLGEYYYEVVNLFEDTFSFDSKMLDNMTKEEKTRFEIFLDLLLDLSQAGGGTTRKYGLSGFSGDSTIGLDIYQYGPATTYLHAQQALFLAESRAKKHGSELAAFRSYIDYPKKYFDQENISPTYQDALTGSGYFKDPRFQKAHELMLRALKENNFRTRKTLQDPEKIFELEEVFQGKMKSLLDAVKEPKEVDKIPTALAEGVEKIVDAPKLKKYMLRPVYDEERAAEIVQRVITRTMNTLMDGGERFVADVPQLQSVDFWMKRISTIDPDMPEDMLHAISMRIVGHVMVQVKNDARVVNMAGKDFIDAAHVVLGSTNAIHELLNNDEVKMGYVADKFSQFGREFFDREVHAITGAEQIIRVAETAQTRARAAASLYIQVPGDADIQKFLEEASMMGGLLNLENSYYGRFLDQYHETGYARKPTTPQIQQRLVQAIEKGFEIESREDVYMRSAMEGDEVSRIISDTIKGLDYLHQENIKTATAYGTTMSITEVEKAHMKNIEILTFAEKFRNDIVAGGSVVGVMNHLEGWNETSTHLWNTYSSFSPKSLASVIYNESPGNIFFVSRSVYDAKRLSAEYLQELDEVFNIRAMYEGNDFIIFRGYGLEEIPAKNIPLRPGDLKASPITSVVDPRYMIRINEILNFDKPVTVGAWDGNFYRIDGERIAEYLEGLGLIDHEEAVKIAYETNAFRSAQSFGAIDLMGMEILSPEGKTMTPVSHIATSIRSAALSNAKEFIQNNFYKSAVKPRDFYLGSAEEAYQTYLDMKANYMTANFVFFDERGHVLNFEPKSVKDMEFILKSDKLGLVFHRGYDHLLKHADEFQLGPVLKATDSILNSYFKLGIFAFNPGLQVRNVVDTPLRMLVTKEEALEKWLNDTYGIKDLQKAIEEASPEFEHNLREYHSIAETTRMITEFNQHLANLENLLDVNARDAYIEGLSETKKIEFLIMLGAADSQVSGGPFSEFMRATDISQLRADVRSYRFQQTKKSFLESVAHSLWNSPLMAGVMKFNSKVEETLRISDYIYKLHLGYNVNQILESSGVAFTDYANKRPYTKIVGAFIPFGNFMMHNIYFWSEKAIKHPMLFRTIVDIGTSTSVDREQREQRHLTTFDQSIAASGNLQLGRNVWMWNPSLFDAMTAIPGFIQDPTARMNLAIKNVEAFLRKDPDSLAHPFQRVTDLFSNTITKTIPKLMKGEPLTAQEMLPGFVWTKNEFQPQYRRYSRSYYSPGVTSYNRMTGYGVSKMGTRYGGRIARSSFHQRKIVLHRGFYSSLYTSTGKSRIGIRTTQKPRPQNLASRIADQNYKFKTPKIKTRFPRIK